MRQRFNRLFRFLMATLYAAVTAGVHFAARRSDVQMQKPVRVITVEREYGSHGAEFAHDLSRHLGWKLLDSELITQAARRAGVEPKIAARFDEQLDPWYYRYGKFLWHDPLYAPVPGSTDEQIFDSDRMLTLIQQEILEASKEGNCVIVGRGAACALVGHPGCFHVFVYATAKAKREWYMKTFPEQASQADAHLAAFDKRRAAVIKKFYQQDWCARGLYHILLNSCMGTHAMIAAVEGATELHPSGT
jgi:cytidylate kinase